MCLVGALAEGVVADGELDLSGVVAQVDEGGLAVASPGCNAARDPVGVVGVLAGLQLGGVVGLMQLGDWGALGAGYVGERLDALRAQALGLGQAFVGDGVVEGVIEHGGSLQEGTSASLRDSSPHARALKAQAATRTVTWVALAGYLGGPLALVFSQWCFCRRA